MPVSRAHPCSRRNAWSANVRHPFPSPISTMRKVRRSGGLAKSERRSRRIDESADAVTHLGTRSAPSVEDAEGPCNPLIAQSANLLSIVEGLSFRAAPTAVVSLGSPLRLNKSCCRSVAVRSVARDFLVRSNRGPILSLRRLIVLCYILCRIPIGKRKLWSSLIEIRRT